MRRSSGIALILTLAALMAVPSFPVVSGSHVQPGAPTADATAGSRSPSAVAAVASAGHGSAVRTDPTGTTVPGATPRNVLVDVPCNVSSNAEVESAYDPSAGVLYETWIGCGGIGFSRSVDGGFSFQPAVTVPGSIGGWDPAIAVSPNGSVYVAYMASPFGDTPGVAWSWDHGQSFAGFSYVFTPPSNTFSDRDFIAIAPNGTLYVTWDYSPLFNFANGSTLDVIGCASGGSCYFTNGDYNIVVAWSSNGGRNWSGFVPVDPEYPWGGAPCGPLIVSPNGTIDVLFEDYNVSGASHALGLGYNYFARSFDGGVNWTTPVAISSYSFPNDVWWIDGAITQDNSGTLYATFDSLNTTADTAWVTLSRDGGDTWRPPLRVNPDVNAAAHNLVGGIGGENGTVYIAWMSNASGSQRAFEVALGGNGSSWGPVTLVSAQDGIPGIWIGDTMGLAYLGAGQAAVSWTYGVNQSGFIGPQVFASVLGESPPGPPSGVSVAPGAGEVAVAWGPPTGPDPVTGYQVSWGVEGALVHNLSFPAGARSTVVANLSAFAHYSVEVFAFNGAGLGAPCPTINFTLTAWTRVSGAVLPVSASVALDGVALMVVGGSFSVNTTYSAHLLTASATDYQGAVLALGPEWNATAWGNFTLTLLPGTVKGYVTPVTSTVEWNGTPVPVAISGFFSFEAPAGSAGAMTVAFPGLIPWQRNLTLAANSTLWENVTLVAPNATLRLALAPTTAALYVDRSLVSTDAGGRAALSLAAGTHSLEATAPTYYALFSNVTLLPGEERNLTLNLTAIPGPVGGGDNGSSSPANPLSDPLVLGLIVGVVVLVLAIVLLGRRGRTRSDSPPEPAPGTYGSAEPADETDGVEVPAEPGADGPPP